MFLPTILLRQFGWWGLIAFAVPNVIGCTAFGYVLTKKKSEDLTRNHISAMRCFSYIVIAYHMFFIPFFIATAKVPLPDFLPQGYETSFAVILAGIVLAAAYAIILLPKRYWLLAALITYAISLATFTQLGFAPLEKITFSGELSLGQLPWIAIVFVFGFLLCPYLDLTFHYARCQSHSKHAFGVFGITFGLMILLTCAYSFSITTGLTLLVTTHIFVQIIFTVAAHLSQLQHTKTNKNSNMHPMLIIGCILIAAASLVIQKIDHPLIISEEFYVRFLVFFGLVFPTYVLLFTGPGKIISRSRKNLIWYLAFVAVSIPLYEIGFFHGIAWLLMLPIAAIITWKSAIIFSAKTP